MQDATNSVADNISAMATESKKLGDAATDFAKSMAESVINALSQMAAQWLVYQAVQLITGKATQASAATAMAANASATSLQAGLAAFASTAAIPIVGPALAPAAMAGMAHDGIDSVPQTGT
jgi:hypothetical protein